MCHSNGHNKKHNTVKAKQQFDRLNNIKKNDFNNCMLQPLTMGVFRF